MNKCSDIWMDNQLVIQHSNNNNNITANVKATKTSTILSTFVYDFT